MMTLPTQAKYSLSVSGEEIVDWDGIIDSKYPGAIHEHNMVIRVEKESANDTNTVVRWTEGSNSSDTDIYVGQGCEFIFEGGTIGMHGYGGDFNNPDYITNTIVIDGGKFTTVPNRSLGTKIGDTHSGCYAAMTTDIDLRNGAVFDGGGTLTIGESSFTPVTKIHVGKDCYFGNVVKLACYSGMLVHNAGYTGEVTVEGGVFDLESTTGESVQFAGVYNDGVMNMQVKVTEGGVFKAGAAEIAMGANQQVASWEGPNGSGSETHFSLYVAGENSQYTMTTGGILGNLANKQKCKGCSLELKIDLRNGGLFSMEGGQVGLSTTFGAKTTLNIEGASTLFSMKGGSLGEVKKDALPEGGTAALVKAPSLTINVRSGQFIAEGGATIGLIEEGTDLAETASSVLNLSGGSFTVKDGAKFAGDINVTGGNLFFGEGCYLGKFTASHSEDEKTVSIQLKNTCKDAVHLDGLDAKYIKEGIVVQGAGASIQGLLAGSTLTMGGKNNTLFVTKQSARGIIDGKRYDGGLGEPGVLIGFGGDGSGSSVVLKEGTVVNLDFGGDLFDELAGEDPLCFEVYFTNGDITLPDGANFSDYFKLASGWGLTATASSDPNGRGKIVFTGDTGRVWFTTRDGGSTGEKPLVVPVGDLTKKDRVVIDADTIIEVPNSPYINETSVKNLTGKEGVTLTIRPPEGEYGRYLTVQCKGDATSHADSVFYGNIVFEGKTGLLLRGVDATYTIMGTVTGEGQIGFKSYNGEKNLTLVLMDKLDIDGALTLTTTNPRVVLWGAENKVNTLSAGAGTLELHGNLTVEQGGSLSSNVTGEGKLILGGTVSLRVDEKKYAKTYGENVSIELREDAFLNVSWSGVSSTKWEQTLYNVSGKGKIGKSDHPEYWGKQKLVLAGEGTFGGTLQGTFAVEGDYTFEGTGDYTEGNIYVQNGGELTVEAGSTMKSLEVGSAENEAEGSKLIISSPNGEADGLHVSGDIHLHKGSETVFMIDPDATGSSGAYLTSDNGKIYVDDGAEFVIDCADEDMDRIEGALAGGLNNLFGSEVLSGEEEGAPFTPEFELGDNLLTYYDGIDFTVNPDGTITPTLHERQTSMLYDHALTHNSKSAATLLWSAVKKKNGKTATSGNILELERSLEKLAQTDPGAAQQALSAIAGSTLTSMSAAQAAALRNQISRVRDHALTAGRLRCAERSESAGQQPCRTTQVWAEATSFFSEQHGVGDESGYRLNSWGGSVGLDAQVDAGWSAGVSLAASYGDLESRAADYAKGDMDSYYVSFWSQAKKARWGNTLLVTFGTDEAELKRTVNYGAGSYTATSSTSGSNIGAMWELTYDLYPVKENKSNIIQPLFSAAVQHTSMDGFSEKNAGSVGLKTDKQTRDTATFALGLRWLASIDSGRAANRTVNTEVRANVAQDLGDRRSVANVALLADPNFTQSVYGGKTGSTAFQFGAGVNVPMTPNSQIYVNAGGELREHANAWNAALGIRVGF